MWSSLQVLFLVLIPLGVDSLPWSTPGESWTAQRMPNPKRSPRACGQTAASSICDPDALLGDSKNLEAALNALALDHDLEGCGGYEMAVAVVRRIEGGTESDTELFAKALLDSWGVGNAACNNGIVLTMAVDDRHLHIATGRGAAEHVPNKELEAAIERMKPLLREQQYVEAAEQCVSDVARVLSGETLVDSSGWLWLVLFTLFFVGNYCYTRSRTAKYNKCKRILSQIERERAEANANRYQVVSCAICLETFRETPRKEKELLRCGHTFHSDCIAKWQNDRGTCPVCREPVGLSTEHYIGPSNPLRRQAVWEPTASYDEEYQFRICRARRLYPDYVSQSMCDRWCAPGYSGPIVADTAFICSSPNYSTGGSSSGSSSSFGGGCSSGGGGAGGSW